ELVSYKPSELVTNVVTTPVSLLVTETLTPSITAPDGSTTVPRISPEFVFCARTTWSRLNKRQHANATCIAFLIIPPFFARTRMLFFAHSAGIRVDTITLGRPHLPEQYLGDGPKAE